MPTYEVFVTRTRVEIASITVRAASPEAAEEKVRTICEPNYGHADDAEQTARMEKRAIRYFANNLCESADFTTEFEYETGQL
jgi:hypothetical protein